MTRTVSLCMSKLVAVIASAAMAVALLPAAAFAADESGTVDAGDGWQLSYSISGDEATITGVQQAGSASLTVPDTAGGKPVTTIGERAFRAQTALTSVTIPSSVRKVGQYSFAGDTALSSVSFQGDSLDYIEAYAFQSCSSLTEFTVPSLTKRVPSSSNYRIGRGCFQDCSKLATIYFLEGTSDGAYSYFSSYDCVDGCSSDLTLVFYCKGAANSRVFDYSNVAHVYYTVDFYNDEASATAGTDRVARVTLPSTTSLMDIVEGKVDASTLYAGSDAIPAAPSGKVWGFSEHAMGLLSSTLDDSCQAVAVDPTDIQYGLCSSSQIAADADWDATSHAIGETRPVGAYYYLNPEGTAVEDIDNIQVYGASGQVIDPSNYSLVFEKKTDGWGDDETWDVVSGGASAITATGSYRVHAEGVGSQSGRSTGTAAFAVAAYQMNVTDYTGSARTEAAGKTAAAVADTVNADGALATIVVPADNWQDQMIGVGLAGAANSVCVPVEPSGTSQEAYRAINGAGSSNIITLGTTKEITSAVNNSIRQQSVMRDSGGTISGSITPVTSSTPQSMANTMFRNVKRYSDRLGFSYGDTAVVLSPSKYYDVAAISQYIYKHKAAVFFTESNGKLSSTTRSNIKSGGFTTVAVVGPTSYVSKTVASQAGKAAGVTAVRLGNKTGSAYQESIRISAQLTGDDAPSATRIVVASAADPCYAMTAGQLAAQEGATLYLCGSTADTKALQARITGTIGQTQVRYLAVCGDFTKVDPNAWTRFNRIWNGTKMSTKVGNGDTFDASGQLYKRTSASKASYLLLMNRAATKAGAASVKLGGKKCQVTAIGAGALSGAKSLTSASFTSAKLSSVGSQAFYNCTKLKTISFKSKKLTKKKVGSKAFKGVSSKVTVKVPKSKVKSYKKIFRSKGLSKKAKVKKI